MMRSKNNTKCSEKCYDARTDPRDNREKSADSLTLPGTNNYTVNALNQYSQITINSITINPSHDDDGNATAYPLPVNPTANAALTYDGENRLIKVITGSTTVEYIYDAFSRRVAKTVGSTRTYYIYDGWNCVAEYTGAVHTTGTAPALTRTYTHTWGLDLSGSLQGAGGVGGLLMSSQFTNNSVTNNFHPLYDGNGNITAYINSSCTVEASFDYDPFGNITNNNNTPALPYAFSTKPREAETGLYYYGYRYYDPVTGRWPSRDLIEEEGGVNLYGMVGNNGLSGVDELGLQPLGQQYSLQDISNMLDMYNRPGPYAIGDGIPYGRDRNFPKSVRMAIELNGICHKCGASGATIPDHVPALSVDLTRTSFRLFPHCACCSRIQARLMSYNTRNDLIYSSASNVRQSFTTNTSSQRASGAAAAAILLADSLRALMLYTRGKQGETMINNALRDCRNQQIAQGKSCCGCCELYIASDYEYMGSEGNTGSWWWGPAIGNPTPGSGNLLPYFASGRWHDKPCKDVPRENSIFYPVGRGIHTSNIRYEYIPM